MKKFTHFIAMALLALSSFTAHANNALCEENLRLGAPSLPSPGSIQVCREGYALMFSTVTKTPVWVAEHLKRSEVFGAAVRSPQFIPDPAIPAKYQAKNYDYAKTGYDRGHMAPAADFSQSQQLMDESFYLSNIVPQNAENNRQIWAGLEKKVRTWLNRRDELYIVTGPVFSGNKIKMTIGKSVAVPDYIFKVILDPKTQASIAFMVPNIPLSQKVLPNYIVSVRDVEMATGLNFHSKLPVETQERIETKRSGMWTR